MTNAISMNAFLTPDGRLPGFAQRRLDSLIEKKKRQSLTPDEARELTEALAYIDEKSAALLRHSAAATRRPAKSPARFKLSKARPLKKRSHESA